jgi:3-phenylpropionate/trans-cinnamate dioxygenase ferredoxin component
MSEDARADARSDDRWTDVGPLADFQVGAPALVRVEGKRVAVIRLADETDGPRCVAVDDACPHAGDPLSLGFVAEGKLWCRSHGWTFDLATGACVAGEPDARLPFHRARVKDGRVEVKTAPEARNAGAPLRGDA